MRPRAYGTVLVAVLIAGCAGPGGPSPPVPSAVPLPSSPAVPSAVPLPWSVAAAAEPHRLVLTAEGNAEIVSIVVEFDGERSTEGPASLPWRKTVEIPADGRPHRWSLTLTHGSGRAELVATVDGALAGRSQGGGTGRGTLRVSGSVDA